MDSKSTPVLYYDIIRDILTNFDRKNLCRLLIVNKRFNLIIEREFSNSSPYLIMLELEHRGRWSMKVENCLHVPVETSALRKIIASKFIRFRLLRVYCNVNFHPMQLLDMSHVWENGELRVFWTDVQNFHPAKGFNRSFSNCSELFVCGNNALSILHEINFGKYHCLDLVDLDYNPISQEVPWTKITDYLFRAVESSDFRIYIRTSLPPNPKKTMEFINFVKEQFQTAYVAVNFKFFWLASYEEWVAFPEIDIQNNQTNQRLKLHSYSHSFVISVR